MTLEITMIVLFFSILLSLILSVFVHSTYQDIERLEDLKPEEAPSVPAEAPVEEPPAQVEIPEQKMARAKKTVKRAVKKAPKRRPRRD